MIPQSNVKAALNPLVILVSNNTKKPGPIEMASKKPQGIAAKMSCIIKCLVFSSFNNIRIYKKITSKIRKRYSYYFACSIDPPATLFSIVCLGLP